MDLRKHATNLWYHDRGAIAIDEVQRRCPVRTDIQMLAAIYM